MRRSNFALRLQPSLLEELRKAAESEGVPLKQMINVAAITTEGVTKKDDMNAAFSAQRTRCRPR